MLGTWVDNQQNCCLCQVLAPASPNARTSSTECSQHVCRMCKVWQRESTLLQMWVTWQPMSCNGSCLTICNSDTNNRNLDTSIQITYIVQQDQAPWLQMKHLLFLWLCGQKNQNCSGFFSTRNTKKCSCSKVPAVSIHKIEALALAVSLFNQSFTYSPSESWDPWCQLSWECQWSWQLHDDNFPYHQDCKLWWELSQAPSILSSSIKTPFCWRCWRFFLTTSPPHPPPSSWSFFSIYTSSNTFLADWVSASCALFPWHLLLCFLSPPVSFYQFSLSSLRLSHAKLIFLANLFSTSF